MMRARLFILAGAVVIVLALLVVWNGVNAMGSGAQASTPTPSGMVTLGPVTFVPVVPLPNVTDLSPNVPTREKGEVIIRHANGEREGFWLSVDIVDAFLSNLPAGDKVETIIPPQSLIGHEPPLPISAPGTPPPGP